MSAGKSVSETKTGADQPQQEPPRQLSEAAKRALEEAEERRAARKAAEAKTRAETELGGRQGPDPVRYGDWENGGIASDF